MRKPGWEPIICSPRNRLSMQQMYAEDDLADDGADNAHVQAVREYAAEQNSESFCNLCPD